MSDQIFREYAPLYWEAGIPAMPLKIRSKAPILSEWTQYGTNMPSAAVRQHWLETYGRSNIGLPFGPASGLCAIDIDTTDDALVAAIEDCLPATPWRRVGKKGCALVFKWQGQKNFKIRSDEGMICEFLGLGNQLVLPPSIHPDTGEAYTANTNLWEVMAGIPALGVDIEQKLRDALGVKGISLSHEGRSKPLDVVPAGERDIQLVRHAGYLARVVFGLDKSQRFSLAEAVAHMVHWIQNFTARVAGDDMDPQKGVAKLLEFLLRDIEGGRTLPEGWDTGLSEEQLAHPTIAAIAEKNKAERWDFVRAREWLTEQVSLKQSDDRWALQKVRELVEFVARDEQFDEFEFDALIPVIEGSLGKNAKMSRPAIKKMFIMARKGGAGDEIAEDHEAIARQVIEDIARGGELRHDQGFFWQWNGSCFGQLEDSAIYRHIAERVKGNLLARRHNDYASIVKTIGALVYAPLEENPELGINFANGFLDMNLQLHEHSPTFGKTFTMPFNYVPARRHECHRFLDMLERAWGDDPDFDDKINALQEVIAATMFGVAPSYQRAVLLYGNGNTGKSVLLNILGAMMPENAVCALPPHRWGERFGLTAMVGKVLNVCGELPEDSMISGDRFKGIVCGEPQDTEYKGKDSFTFKPLAAHWFASNHLPRSRDTSDGFIRRWIIFEFTRKVPESERIMNFSEVVIAEEREAIAAWAVDGLKRLLAQKEYTLPASHKRLENLVFRSNNSVAAFLQSSERVRPEEGSQADCRTVFDQYLFYMKDVSRGYGVTFERFKAMLEGLGYRVDEYQDEMRVTRDKIHGLKVTVPAGLKS
jgi:putative DNA primase/helicase